MQNQIKEPHIKYVYCHICKEFKLYLDVPFQEKDEAKLLCVVKTIKLLRLHTCSTSGYNQIFIFLYIFFVVKSAF